MVEEFKLDADGLQRPLRDGDVVTLLAISPQFANAVTLEGPCRAAAALPVHAGHAHQRPDPRPRSADLARLLSAQEPAGADHRGGRGRPRARRPATAQVRTPGMPATPGTAVRTPRRAAIRQHGSRARRSTRTQAGDSAAPAVAAGRSASRTRRRPAPRPPAATSGRPPTLFEELNWDYAVIERLNTKDLIDPGHPVQPRPRRAAARPGAERRAAAGRRGDGLQPEGHARAGGAPDAPGVGGRRSRRARRLPAAARRNAEGAARRAPAASRRRPTSTASSSAARKRACASART